MIEGVRFRSFIPDTTILQVRTVLIWWGDCQLVLLASKHGLLDNLLAFDYWIERSHDLRRRSSSQCLPFQSRICNRLAILVDPACGYRSEMWGSAMAATSLT